MTEWHRHWQEQFPLETREVVVKVNGEQHRADVLINNTVYEFQHSPMTAEEFYERTQFYTAAGYRIVWLFDFCDQYYEEKIKYIDDERSLYKWQWPAHTFDYFNLKDENVELYFQVLGDDLQQDVGLTILKVVWKTPGLMKRFVAHDNDWLSGKEFIENTKKRVEIPQKEIPIYACDLDYLWHVSGARKSLTARNKETNNIIVIEEKPDHQFKKTGECYGYVYFKDGKLFNESKVPIYYWRERRWYYIKSE